MAWRFVFEDNVTSSVNLTPTTHSLTIYNLLRALLAGGWVKTQDSDGTTYSNTGAQVTGGASGAHGLDNPKAWFVVRNPNSTLWSTIQRDAQSSGLAASWRVKFSVSNPTSGAPAAQQVPSVATATDEVVVLGGGTDAAPTFTAWFENTQGTMRQQLMVMDAAPYSVLMLMWKAARANSFMTCYLVDGMSPAMSTSDPVPFVVRVMQQSQSDIFLAANLQQYGTGTNALKSMKNGAARAWVNQVLHSLCTNGGNPILPGGGSTNPEDAKDDQVFGVWGRINSQAAPVGVAGVSSVLKWNSITRSFGDLYTNVSTGDELAVNDIAVPWPTGVAVTI